MYIQKPNSAAVITVHRKFTELNLTKAIHSHNTWPRECPNLMKCISSKVGGQKEVLSLGT